MKHRVIPSVAAIVAFFCCCVSNTGNDPENGTSAVIYQQDEKTPAASATVKIFRAIDTTGRPEAIRITDEFGRYSSDNLPDGNYNVLVYTDSLALFQDSVIISHGRGLRDGILACPSSVSGKVALQPQHDARTARIRIRGTDRSMPISDIGGNFTFGHMAGGTYTFDVTTSISGYRPLSVTIDIDECRDTTLPGSALRPVYTGVPVVEGVTATLDTLNGTISLNWSDLSRPGFLEYLVFRNDCGGITGTPPILATTKNNVFIDTTFRSLPADKRDTVGRCLQYRIAARTLQQDIGPFHACNEITFVNKAVITTFCTHSVVNPYVPGDSASINDPFVVTVTAKNQSRALTRLVWFDPTRADSIASAATSGDSAAPYTLRDSIRYSFPETGIRWFYAVITDNSGSRWVDTIPVRIVKDIPVANAGKDTSGLPGDVLILTGKAKQQFGTISQWFWKIGENDWSASPDGRISITVPPQGTTQVCSLAVVDDDGNRATDAVLIYSSSKLSRIAAGNTTSLFLSIGGTLWGSGSNFYGQLSTTWSSSTSDPVELTNNVREMAVCGNSCLIVKNDNTLWVCGDNSSGLLDDQDIRSYKLVLRTYNVKSVAAGPSNCLILKTDGSLWASGSNAYGQLGNGTSAYTITHTPVQVMTDVLTMAIGDYVSLIVKTDHTLWACGGTSFFPALLGSSDTASARVIPALAMTDVQDVAMGLAHLVVLKTDGTCWTCGYNGDGEVGDGTTENSNAFYPVMNNVVSIAAGSFNTFFLKNDGTLWGCGRNASGELGNGTSGGPQTVPFQIMTDVQSAAPGMYHTLILKTDGTLWTCGSNSSGQFGDGSYLYSTVPKQSFTPRY